MIELNLVGLLAGFLAVIVGKILGKIISFAMDQKTKVTEVNDQEIIS